MDFNYGTPVLLAFGSNVGERLANIKKAIELLRAEVTVLTVSRVVESEPMYDANQDRFLNGALVGMTDLGPFALLGFLKHIETECGRQVRTRYGPRELDLDIILYGSLRLISDRLTVPHPNMLERPFVTEPAGDAMNQLEASVREGLPAVWKSNMGVKH